jgi:hypothetical protein
VVPLALVSSFVLSSLGHQVFRWCSKLVVSFMYYMCGCRCNKLLFYLNAMHALGKKSRPQAKLSANNDVPNPDFESYFVSSQHTSVEVIFVYVSKTVECLALH